MCTQFIGGKILPPSSLFLRGLPEYGLSQPDNLAQCGATQFYCATFYPKSTFVLLEAQISDFDVRQSRFKHDDVDDTVSAIRHVLNQYGLGQFFPYLDGTTSDSSEEVLSMPLLPELFILNPSSLLHCCIMVLFPMDRRQSRRQTSSNLEFPVQILTKRRLTICTVLFARTSHEE